VPIPGPRGRILDRDGRVIVDNHSSFSLILAREQAKDEHLRPIAQGLDLDFNDLYMRVVRMRKQPKYVPIVIKDELSAGDLAFACGRKISIDDPADRLILAPQLTEVSH
jgi:penicillin-binding protein 2